MTADILSTALLLSAIWVILVVVGHFALFHLVRVEPRARALVGLFVAGLVGYLLTCIGFRVNDWRIAYGAVVLFCAFILYMPFYYSIAASLSVRMLIEIDGAPKGLSLDDLRRRIQIEKVLAGRLQILVAAGYLSHAGERFAITVRGRAIAQPFRLIKALWRLGPGG